MTDYLKYQDYMDDDEELVLNMTDEDLMEAIVTEVKDRGPISTEDLAETYFLSYVSEDRSVRRVITDYYINQLIKAGRLRWVGFKVALPGKDRTLSKEELCANYVRRLFNQYQYM